MSLDQEAESEIYNTIPKKDIHNFITDNNLVADGKFPAKTLSKKDLLKHVLAFVGVSGTLKERWEEYLVKNVSIMIQMAYLL
jgi:hypothetical protein